jgi:acetyl-CoA C-acetyltransferase
MGRHGGALAQVRPDDLAAAAIKGVLKQVPKLAPEDVYDVYLGCSNQAGEDNRNVARMASLLAGLPESVPGCTVNRLCASGLEAINSAARCILAGEGDVYIAGGVESMSRAPWAFPKAAKAFPFGNVTGYDTSLGWRFPNPKMEKLFPLESMGETAENLADRFPISREEQDAFALESHQNAVAAAEDFKNEIIPITIAQRKGPDKIVSCDDTPRADTSIEALAKLRPAFRKDGTVTAGNSSSLNDGASALVLMEGERAKSLGIEPLAVWRGGASAGVDPRVMGIGPVYAVQKLLKRLDLKTKDVDLVEINEAFAVQALACARELNIKREQLNVRGGAIALGHPLGCSGARIVTTLVHQMRRADVRRGLATLCIGVGQGLAAVFERP